VEDLHGHVQAGSPLLDAAGQHATEIGVVLHDRRDHAEGGIAVHRRRRHVAHNQVEHGGQVLAGTIECGVGPALAARGIQHREVELVVVGAEGGEQVKHLGMHLIRAGVGAVHLVDHDDRMEAAGERLADDELGLREDALGGVHQDDGAVHHVQDAFHLAAEVGVAGGVDDVDAGVAPEHRGALGEDGDASLALQVVAVHRALGHHLVVAERAGLAEELVDEGGLAVIDVGDDRDVADLHGGLGYGDVAAHT
jgi:hypothetical protein